MSRVIDKCVGVGNEAFRGKGRWMGLNRQKMLGGKVWGTFETFIDDKPFFVANDCLIFFSEMGNENFLKTRNNIENNEYKCSKTRKQKCKNLGPRRNTLFYINILLLNLN